MLVKRCNYRAVPVFDINPVLSLANLWSDASTPPSQVGSQLFSLLSLLHYKLHRLGDNNCLAALNPAIHHLKGRLLLI